MKHKARILEVGADGYHAVVTLDVPDIEDARAIASHLYEDATIEVGPELPCYVCADPVKDKHCSTAVCAACGERLRLKVQELQKNVAEQDDENVEKAERIFALENEISVITTQLHEAVGQEPLDRLDELLGRLLLPGGKAEHVSASEIHELVDEVNELRARKKIGGSNVCETCDAHAQTIEHMKKTIDKVYGIIDLHCLSLRAEGKPIPEFLQGCMNRIRKVL